MTLFDRALAGSLGDELPLDDVAVLIVATFDNPEAPLLWCAAKEAKVRLLGLIERGLLPHKITGTRSVPTISIAFAISLDRTRPRDQPQNSSYEEKQYLLSRDAIAELVATGRLTGGEGLAAWVKPNAIESKAAKVLVGASDADNRAGYFSNGDLKNEFGNDLFERIVASYLHHPGKELESVRKQHPTLPKRFIYHADNLQSLIEQGYPGLSFGDTQTWSSFRPKGKAKGRGTNGQEPLKQVA